MNKLMKRLLVLTIFVICILALTVLGASAASNTSYTTDEDALAADSTFVARIGQEGVSAKYYTSIEYACAAASNGSTIYIFTDFTSTAENDSGAKTLVIEGVAKENGDYPTITHTGADLFNAQLNSNITVKNLNIDTVGYLVYSTGNITFGEGVTITGTIKNNHLITFAPAATSGSKTVTFASGCTIDVTLSGKMLTSSVANSTLVFDGTDITVATGGSDTLHNFGKLLITENTSLSILGGGDGIENRGTFLMSGGVLDAGSNLALYNNGGTTYITGGTVTGTYAENGSAKTYIIGSTAIYTKATSSSVHCDDAAAAANGYFTRLNTAGTEIELPDSSSVTVRPVSQYYTSIDNAVKALTAHNMEVVLIANWTQKDAAITKGNNFTYTLTSIDNDNITLTVACSWLFDIGAGNTNNVTLRDITINVASYNLGYFSNKNGIVIDSGTYIYGTGMNATNGLIHGQNNSAKIVVKEGARIEATGSYPIFGLLNADVVIEGGTLEGRSIARVADTAKITIQGGTINFKGTDKNSDRAFHITAATASFTMSGGTIKSFNATCSNVIRSEGPFTMTGGTIDVDAVGNNPIRLSNTATITGGTIENTSSTTTIYVTTGANVTISGLTLTGNSGLLTTDAGTTTITSGSYSSTDFEIIYASGTSTVNISGGTFVYTTGSKSMMSVLGKSTVNISSGDFRYSGTGNLIYANADAADAVVLVHISGGTLVHDGSAGHLVAYYSEYKSGNSTVAGSKKTKIHITGSAVLIHEGSGTNYVFYRGYGNLLIDGEDVVIVARKDNYLFEQAYQDTVADFNNTSNLKIRGAYLYSERQDGVIVIGDPSYYDFAYVSLDSDSVAATLHGSSYYYFPVRLGTDTREVVIPATNNYAAITKTVYNGYCSDLYTAVNVRTNDTLTIYMVRDFKLARQGFAIENGVQLTIEGNGHRLEVNGSNATWLFKVYVNSSLTIQNVEVWHCPTYFAEVSGDLTLGDNVTMPIWAAASGITETSPVIRLWDGGNAVISETASIITSYKDDTVTDTDPAWNSNNLSFYIIQSTNTWAGELVINGILTQGWNVTSSGWSAVLRLDGSGTVVLGENAALTMTTAAGSANGNAMIIGGGSSTITIRVPKAGATLSSTNYPVFSNGIYFDVDASAANLGYVARLGDTLKATTYYNTLLAAISAIPTNDTVVCLIADHSTGTIYSPKSSGYKAGVNGTPYSFTLTSSDKNSVTLTVGSAWMFDLGSGATVVPTLENITIDINSRNLGYLNNVTIVIGAGAHIYGTGSSATNGLILARAGTDVILQPGSLIEVTSGTNPVFALQDASYLTGSGATIKHSGTGYAIWSNGSGTTELRSMRFVLNGAGVVNDATDQNSTVKFYFYGGSIDATISTAATDFVSLADDTFVEFCGMQINITATYSSSNNPLLTNAATLVFSGSAVIDVTTNGMDFIHNTGTFIIQDNVTLTLTGGGDGIENRATFIMKGGTVNTGSKLAVYNNNATAYITGGKITGTYASNAADKTKTYIIGSNASFAGATNATVYYDDAAAIACGKKVRLGSDMLEIVLPAELDGKTVSVCNTFQATLADGVAAADATDTVVVLGDHSSGIFSLANKTLIFTSAMGADGKPIQVFTVTCSTPASNFFKLAGSANLTVQHLTLYSTGYIARTEETFTGNTLTLNEGATFKSSANAGNIWVIRDASDTVITIHEGAALVIEAANDTDKARTPNLIQINSTFTGSLTIDGGTFENNTAGTLISASIGTLNISGGTFTHHGTGNIVYVSGGSTLNISGGTFVHYGADSYMINYETKATKISLTGSATLIHEGTGAGYIFYRGTGGLWIDGEDVKLVARGNNYIFEQAYQNSEAFGTEQLYIRGAYLYSERADGVICVVDPQSFRLNFGNVTLDNDAAANKYIGKGNYVYFGARLNDVTAEIVIPATEKTASLTKTVYRGYYTTLTNALAAATADCKLYVTSTHETARGMTVAYDTEIDLGGYTVTATGSGYLFTVNDSKTLTFKNGTFSCAASFATLTGDLILAENATVTGAYTTGTMIYLAGANADLTIHRTAAVELKATAATTAETSVISAVGADWIGKLSVAGRVEAAHTGSVSYAQYLFKLPTKTNTTARVIIKNGARLILSGTTSKQCVIFRADTIVETDNTLAAGEEDLGILIKLHCSNASNADAQVRRAPNTNANYYYFTGITFDFNSVARLGDSGAWAKLVLTNCAFASHDAMSAQISYAAGYGATSFIPVHLDNGAKSMVEGYESYAMGYYFKTNASTTASTVVEDYTPTGKSTMYLFGDFQWARKSGSYHLPAGADLTIDGGGHSVTVNGSNAQWLFVVPETSSLSVQNVIFTHCPTRFAKVQGNLAIGSNTTFNIYAASGVSESCPLVGMDGTANITLQDGAVINYANNASVESPVAGYATTVHVFATLDWGSTSVGTEYAWSGTLTIAGEIRYAWTTSQTGAFVYTNNISSGNVTVTDTAVLNYTGASTAANNAYFIIYGSTDLTIPATVVDATPKTANYPLYVGIQMQQSGDSWVVIIPENYKFKLSSTSGVQYFDTLEDVYAAITTGKSYTIFLLSDYTFQSADCKTFSGTYDITIAGIDENVVLTETVSGWMYIIKAGAKLTFRNVTIKTNGSVVQNDAGGTNTYLTVANGTKIIGQSATAVSGKFFELWNAGHFTLETGASIDTNGIKANGAIELIVGASSFWKTITINGDITHDATGAYNHKILRLSSSRGTVNVSDSTLTYACPDVTSNEAAILYNYANSVAPEKVAIVYNVTNATLLHTSPKGGVVVYLEGYGPSTVNVGEGALIEKSGDGYVAHLTFGSAMNMTSGKIKATNVRVFTGDYGVTYNISGDAIIELYDNASLIRDGETLNIKSADVQILIKGTDVTGLKEGGDASNVYYSGVSFADDATASLLLANFRYNGLYYTSLAEVLELLDYQGTLYVVGNGTRKVNRSASGFTVAAGTTLTIVGVDGLGVMNVNGLNDKYLFIANGTLILQDITLTGCPTNLAKVAGTMQLVNTDVYAYTHPKAEAAVNETSPLFYLIATGEMTVDKNSALILTYEENDDRDVVDHQANVSMFHTASDWMGELVIDGYVKHDWDTVGHSAIFYLESTAGLITVNETAKIYHAGKSMAADNALLIAPVGGATEFYIHKLATVQRQSYTKIRVGDVQPLSAHTAEVLEYTELTVCRVIITWGAMEFTYTPGVWNTDTMDYDDGTWIASEEGDDQISLNNMGNTIISADFSFTAEDGLTELEGSFTKNGEPVNGAVELVGDETIHVFTFVPQGNVPDDLDPGTTVGRITITLTDGGN